MIFIALILTGPPVGYRNELVLKALIAFVVETNGEAKC